jgi:alpha/beta superfamily hydrolase
MSLPADTEFVEVVCFPAGGLLLEGRLGYPETATPVGGVVIAGPHPLLGGDVENNVVRGLTAGLARRGVAALAFNYRGVGESGGSTPDVAAHLAEFWATSHVPEEPAYAADLRAAVEAMQEMTGPCLPLALVSYSFGCSILPTAGIDARVPMALIAPTVGTHDYAAFGAVPNPLLVIAPDGDFAADAGRLAKWFDGLTAPKRLVRGAWDDHFFRGHEERLAGLIFDFLRDHWEGNPCR